MDWAWWSASLDRILHSPNLPLWAAIAAAGFIALILIIALLRADKSVANGVLAAITLLAMAVAGFATFRSLGTGSDRLYANAAVPAPAAMPALACIDDLAGDTVLAACERALFGSPESVAAAVAYASARLARLTSHGDVGAADKLMTPELARLRQSIERDRYGLIAYVLAAKDGCHASDCPAYRSLTDHSRIAANMNERAYEAAVARHAPSWGVPATTAAVQPPAGAQALAATADAPTGKPTSIDFPSAASIPPISIMTADPAPSPSAAPGTPSPAAAAPPARSVAQPRPPAASRAMPQAGTESAARPPAAAQASANRPAAAPAQTAAKKPPAAPPKPKPAPVQLAPEDANADN